MIVREKPGQRLGVNSKTKLRENHLSWLEDAPLQNKLSRDNKWTESLAVGSQQFAESYLASVGLKTNSVRVKTIDNAYVVNDPQLAYRIDF